MTRTVAPLIACAFIGACGVDEKAVCGGSSQKHYDEGLALHLARAGVPFERSPGGGLCAPEKYRARFKEAERELERYFPQIAYDPRSECEEQAYVEWAKERKLRHDLVEARRADGRPAGKLFLLRPYTAGEYAAYREWLRELPTLANCWREAERDRSR